MTRNKLDQAAKNRKETRQEKNLVASREGKLRGSMDLSFDQFKK
jgi:hypothetical protein